MDQITPKEVKILESAEDIQERRDQVLHRYGDFKSEARSKREKLEDSRRFQYFKRDADELESWIYEKLQAASDESYKDPTNLQAKIQKHQAFEAEVAAHSNAIVVLDNTGMEMINQAHFSSDIIRRRLGESSSYHDLVPLVPLKVLSRLAALVPLKVLSRLAALVPLNVLSRLAALVPLNVLSRLAALVPLKVLTKLAPLVPFRITIRRV
uniref:Spna2 protein n=1 Tax=Timema bartmani TaxID=61472 RepID=A0A7R9EWA9_9NEOP|nr:unnamed protein product [Timema bartmani]